VGFVGIGVGVMLGACSGSEEGLVGEGGAGDALSGSKLEVAVNAGDENVGARLALWLPSSLPDTIKDASNRKRPIRITSAATITIWIGRRRGDESLIRLPSLDETRRCPYPPSG
jgi:hypothetical protein